MFIPQWFIIAVVVFIIILLVRLAQLHAHLEELRDTVVKLEEDPTEADNWESKSEPDWGGN